MSENQPTYRRCKEGVLSESQLILQCAHQISRCSVDIPLSPSSMNTPHAIYPIERSCSNLKRKRAAPEQNSRSRGDEGERYGGNGRPGGSGTSAQSSH